MQNTRPAGKFGTTADNLFMGDTVMDNRIDLQCCIILSLAAGWARPHTDTGEEMTQVCQYSQYAQCIVSPRSCDQSTACLHNLVPGDWQLTPPHPAACVQSSQPLHYTQR